MEKTENNLKEAFSGESQARNKYTFFSVKAEEEGKPQIAKLFRAAAMAEKIHARNHFKAMNGVESTADNLKAAIQGENYEHSDMYPKFIKDAEEEGKSQALKSFQYANEVEKVHEELYKKALEATESEENMEEENIYVCQVCGNTVLGEAPDKCPICGAPKKKFEKIE